MQKSKISIILILVTIFIMGTFVSAVKEQTKNKAKQFLSIDKENASIGDIVTMTLDLTQINYDEFVLTIQADKQIIDNSEITAQKNTESGITVIEKGAITLEKESDVTMKLFASKKNLNTDEIKLCFVVPESLNVGDKINLNATIEEIEDVIDDKTLNESSIEGKENTTNKDEELQDKIENIEDKEETNEKEQAESVKEESKETSLKNENKIEEVIITITIIDKTNKVNTMDANAINLENVFKEENSTQKSTSNTQSSSTASKSKTSSSNDTVETYKGSSNKYLSNIEVKGYQLTPEFNITNTTYFLEVESDVTTLNITTEKYDSSEIVTIYGNEELKTGINKILINVTAEDGSAKIYRIYVTKK